MEVLAKIFAHFFPFLLAVYCSRFFFLSFAILCFIMITHCGLRNLRHVCSTI